MKHGKQSGEEVSAGLANFPEWVLQEEKWIVRRYRFPSFALAIGFVNEVAKAAGEMNHHPMISVDYRMVTLKLTTWSAGGLTELDWKLAARCDEAYQSR